MTVLLVFGTRPEVIKSMVVVMVKHQHILDNMAKLKGKVVLDCHNIIKGMGKIYHI